MSSSVSSIVTASPVRSARETTVHPSAIHPIAVRQLKPLWRGWLHLLWFEASLVAGTLLLATTDNSHRGAATLYVVSVSTMFGASALYHRGNWSPRFFSVWQRVDHSMIFVLIGGTATPVFLVAVGGGLGTFELAILWTLIGAALLARVVWTQAPERLAGGTYIGLGCLGAVALPAVWTQAGIAAFALILTGGILYIIGAVLYLHRWPDPVPSHFGFHEVFHVFVCVAATLQYLAIALLVL